MKTRSIALGATIMAMLCMYGLWDLEKSAHSDAALKSKVRQMAQVVLAQKIRTQIAEARFSDFKQEVALAFSGEDLLSGATRDLASIIPHNQRQDKHEVFKSRKYLKQGRRLFDAKKYDECIETFLQVVSEYPDSPVFIESVYYLVQSFHKSENNEEAIKWSRKLLANAPESLWTAKSLFIMADIYEEQDRENEALEVYDALKNSFNDIEVQNEVKLRLSKRGSY